MLDVLFINLLNHFFISYLNIYLFEMCFIIYNKCLYKHILQ